MKKQNRQITRTRFQLNWAASWGGLVAFVLWACASACSSNRAANPLRVQLDREPVSLDPGSLEDGVGLQVISNTSDGLFGYDSDGKLEKRLVGDYSISTDGKHLEFSLRGSPNSFPKWSDGKDIVLADFVTAFRRGLGPKSLSKLAPLFFPIKNARAYYEGKLPVEALGVRESKGRLIIELEEKTPYFLHLLSLPLALPIRQEILESHSGKWLETDPVTGPYRITAHKIDQVIHLERNPFYWGKLPPLEKIEYRIVTDESTAVHLLERGQLDILTRLSSLDYSRLNKQGRVRTDPFFTTYYLEFNCRRPPFNERVLRQAVSGIIRRTDVTDSLGSGETPAWSWIPKGLEGYEPYQDPAKVFVQAVQKLQIRGSVPPPLVAGFDHNARNARIFELLQQNLSAGLGMKVTLEQWDWKAYLRKVQADPPPLFRMAWAAPISDPISHLQAFTKGNPNNYSGCTHPEYDRLVAEIAHLEPGPERARKIAKAQKILLVDEAMLVPLYHYVQNTAFSPRVKSVKANPFGIIRVQDLRLE